MIVDRSHVIKTAISLGIVAFLLVGAGVPHFGMTMNTDMDGNMTMSDCYMPGMTAVCNMSPLEHVASWQSMFTSTPAQNFTLMLLLLVLVAVISFIWIEQTHSPPLALQRLSLSSRRREYIPLHSSLQELFSNGILNPKVF